MIYFLDTNIIIYAMKGTFPALPSHFARIPSQSIVIPSIVMGEIEYGARKCSDYSKTIQKYHAFTNVFNKIGFSTDEDCVAYGKIRAQLEKDGCVIGQNDLLIASIAFSHGGTLVTHNIKEFTRIKGLIVEDWTK